jgi:hypothetical protein
MATDTAVTLVSARFIDGWATGIVREGGRTYDVEFIGKWRCSCRSRSCRHVMAMAIEWDRRQPGVTL